MKVKRNLRGKVLSIVLSIAMLLVCIPFGGITVNASETPATLYLKPNSNWTQASARFAAYFFDNGEKWVDMTDADGDGIYEVEVPSGYPKVIFCRMNPSASANNWNNKWNQSDDITIPTNGTNMCTVSAGAWGKDDGSWKCTWSTHTVSTWTPPATAETMTVVLNPNIWDAGGAWFAVYSYTGSEGTWTAMTKDSGSGLYTATISNQYQYFKFYRMNSASQDLTTDNSWNYSSVLEYPTDGTNMYTIADGEWNAGGGTWSTVDPNNLPQKAQNVAIDTLYLYPTAAWLEANARFAVYAFDADGNNSAWFNMSDTDGDGIYAASINSDAYAKVIFVRLDPSVDPTTAENPWDGNWGQTANLIPMVDNANLYKLTDGNSGTWAIYDELSDYTVEVSDQTYTGSALTPSVTVKDGDSNTISADNYDLSYANNTNAGTATVTVTFKNTGAYAGKLTKNFTINPASAVIGTVTADVVYDSTNPADVDLKRSDETIPGTLVITDSVLTYGTNTYNWKFTPTDSNYAEITGTVIVKVAVNSAADGGIDYTYNDSTNKTIEVELNGNTVKTITNGNTTLTEGEDYTVSVDGVITINASYLKTLDADEYTLTISYNPQGVEDSEIKLNDSNITLSVGQKTITINGATANNKAYDGTTTVKITKVTLDGIVGSDAVSVDVTSATGSLSSAEAGAYDSVTVSGSVLTGADAKNYKLAENSYTVDTTETVYVVANSEAITDTITHTYQNASDAIASVKLNGNSIKGIENGNSALVADKDYFASEEGVITIEGAYLNTLDAGEYTLTISYKPQGMELSGITVNTTSIKLKVEPKTITINGATATNKAYDGTTSVKITAATLDGVVSGDVVSVDVSGATGKLSSANTGSYNSVTVSGAVLTGADAANYKLAEDSYTVDTTATVYVYESSETVTGTITHTYNDSADATVTVDLNGNTVNDIVNGTTTLTVDEDYTVSADGVITLKADYLNTLDAGEYTLTVSFNPQGTQISGVTLQTASIKLTVLAKEITVSAAMAESKDYDGKTSVKITSVTLNGIVSGDVVSVDLSKVTGNISSADVGEYDRVTVSALELTGEDAKNYKLTTESYTVVAVASIQVEPIVITGVSIEPNVTAQAVGKEIVLIVKTTGNTPSLGIKVVHEVNESTITLTNEGGVYTATYKVPADAVAGDVIIFTVYTIDSNYTVNAVSTSVTVNEAERTPLPAPEGTDDTVYKMEMETGINSVPEGLKDKEDLDTTEKIVDKMQESITNKNDKIPSSNVEIYDVVLRYSEDDGETWITADENNFPAGGITVRLPYPEGTGKATHKFIVAHMFTTATNGKTIGDVEYPTVTLGDDYIEFTVTSLSPISLGWELISSSDDENGGNVNGGNNDSGNVDNGNSGAGNAGDESNNGNNNQPELIPDTSDGSFMGLYVLMMMAGFGLIVLALRTKKTF